MKPRLHRVALLGLLVLGAVQTEAEPRPVRPSPCAVRYPSDAAIQWTCRRLRRGETLERRFGERWIDVARLNRIDRRHAVAGVGLKEPADLEAVRDFTPMPARDAFATAGRLIVIDLAEQFLGAYDGGRLVFSAPVTTGSDEHPTPTGDFRITAIDPARRSSLYAIEGTTTPYPMNHALRFHISAEGVAFWIHGRDLPGYPASHGCIGLYDEAMQRQYYGRPAQPVLDDARTLYTWVAGDEDGGGFRTLRDGPAVRITGQAPSAGAAVGAAPRAGVERQRRAALPCTAPAPGAEAPARWTTPRG